MTTCIDCGSDGASRVEVAAHCDPLPVVCVLGEWCPACAESVQRIREGVAVTTTDAIRQALLTDATNPLHKLAYADVLEEAGRSALAYAYRWMAGWGKHPHRRAYYRNPDGSLRSKVPEQYGWAWWSVWTPSGVRIRECVYNRSVLPRLVFLAVSHNREHYFCGSLDAAVAALADGLELMRAQREANP